MQTNLFCQKNKEIILDHDSCLVTYFPTFLSDFAAQKFFEKLSHRIAWQQDRISLYGKEHDIPRLQAWYAENALGYSYSGIKMKVNNWTDDLLKLKSQVELATEDRFNSMLANYYRTGKDYVAWHSDDEKELGQRPTIASLSLGSERRFLLRRKQTKEKIEVIPASGSLLVMQGLTQNMWHHCVAKTSREVGPRINLTFRKVLRS